MTHEEVRNALETKIIELVNARDNCDDPEEREELSNEIDSLQDEADRLDIIAANKLGAKVNEIIGRLDVILDDQPLDAGSALARTLRRLRNDLNDLAGDG